MNVLQTLRLLFITSKKRPRETSDYSTDSLPVTGHPGSGRNETRRGTGPEERLTTGWWSVNRHLDVTGCEGWVCRVEGMTVGQSRRVVVNRKEGTRDRSRLVM